MPNGQFAVKCEKSHLSMAPYLPKNFFFVVFLTLTNKVTIYTAGFFTWQLLPRHNLSFFSEGFRDEGKKLTAG